MNGEFSNQEQASSNCIRESIQSYLIVSRIDIKAMK